MRRLGLCLALSLALHVALFPEVMSIILRGPRAYALSSPPRVKIKLVAQETTAAPPAPRPTPPPRVAAVPPPRPHPTPRPLPKVKHPELELPRPLPKPDYALARPDLMPRPRRTPASQPTPAPVAPAPTPPPSPPRLLTSTRPTAPVVRAGGQGTPGVVPAQVSQASAPAPTPTPTPMALIPPPPPPPQAPDVLTPRPTKGLKDRSARPVANKPHFDVPPELKGALAKIRLQVVLDIGADGSVQSANLLTPTGNSKLDQEIQTRLKTWKWEPAVKDGQMIASQAKCSFDLIDD